MNTTEMHAHRPPTAPCTNALVDTFHAGCSGPSLHPLPPLTEPVTHSSRSLRSCHNHLHIKNICCISKLWYLFPDNRTMSMSAQNVELRRKFEGFQRYLDARLDLKEEIGKTKKALAGLNCIDNYKCNEENTNNIE